LEAFRPDVVVLPFDERQTTEQLTAWLNANYREERGALWQLYVRLP
jgi:hypothetical protein